MARCTGCGEGPPHIIALFGVVRTRYTVAKETLPIGLRRLAHRGDFGPTQSVAELPALLHWFARRTGAI